MYFTREPVIETVVTSREGYKLTIRSAKNPSFEPLIVDALEVVSLGRGCFFRNSDRTKSFLLPVSDYEIFELRDARVNLKALGIEKGIKIAGGRATSLKIPKDKVLQPLNGKAVEKEEVSLVTVIEEVIEEVIDNHAKTSSEDTLALVLVAETPSGSKSKKSWKEKKHNKKKFKEISEERVKSSEGSNEESPSSNKKFCLIPPPALLISEVIGNFNPSVFREEQASVSETHGENEQGVSCSKESVSVTEIDSFDPMSLTNVSCPDISFFEEDSFSVNSVFEIDDF